MVDALQTAVREVFEEQGFDVEVSIAIHKNDGMGFSIKRKDGLEITEETFDFVLKEATTRIGGSI